MFGSSVLYNMWSLCAVEVHSVVAAELAQSYLLQLLRQFLHVFDITVACVGHLRDPLCFRVIS